MPRASLEERFWANVTKGPGCWVWNAGRTDRGYGRISAAGRKEYAHRVSARLAGLVVPDGAHVCHRCDNPPCVRPDHLFVGTAADNHEDMVRKGRSTRGERNPAHKLTAEQVLEIRARAAAGDRLRLLASVYGVHPVHVSLIVRRGVWGHLGDRS